jgi:hypothetical protein
MTERVSSTRLAIIAVILGLNCTQGAAADDYCSSTGFHDYYSNVIKDPGNIKNVLSGSYVVRTLVSIDSKGNAQFSVSKKTDAEALEIFETGKNYGSNRTAKVSDYDDIVVTDGEGKTLLVYKFTNKNCWQLSSVEDWTLDPMLQSTNKVPDSLKAMSGLPRGDLYNDLAVHEESNSRVYLFEVALESYLDGAKTGSDESAYKAVALSLSGEAPRLSNGDIFYLLNQSSKTSKEGALALADFYCDQGQEKGIGSCLNPKGAVEALVQAAHIGSPEALYRLAQHYEAGDGVDKNIEKALSCYKAAASAGESGSLEMRRLESQGVKENDNEKTCGI